jgi:hypothetical protein
MVSWSGWIVGSARSALSSRLSDILLSISVLLQGFSVVQNVAGEPVGVTRNGQMFCANNLKKAFIPFNQ